MTKLTGPNHEPDDIRDGDFRQALNASARLLHAKRPGEAVSVLEPLHRQHPNDPDVAINLGGALIMQHRWNRAVAVLLPVARCHLHNAMLWTNLAAAQLGRLETSGPKQKRQAISAYEQALRADPKAPNVHYHLGLIYKEQGNLSRASALFQRALEVNPADKDAQRWLDRLSEMIVAQAAAQHDWAGKDAANDETSSADGAE